MYNVASNSTPVCISIPLRGGPEPMELTEEFLKVIEKEYAVRYLEQLGIEPTRSQINSILLEAPLKKCVIKAGWLSSSGWLADAIHIYPKGVPADSEPTQSPYLPNQSISNIKQNSSPLPRKHDESEEADKLSVDMTINGLKHKFLFPFFATNTSRPSPAPTPPESAEFFMSRLFRFPFEDITVSTPHIRDMMKPITATADDISQYNTLVLSRLPLKGLKDQLSTSRAAELDKAVRRLKSEKFIRLVGLASHFSYWTIFGHLHNSEMTSDNYQQMFVNILFIFNDMEPKNKKKRQLYNSITLLILRILVEHIFYTTYKSFFTINEQATLASSKIQDVLTKLLDPELFFSRLSFLESKFDAIHLAPKVRENIPGKFFSTSSAVKSLLARPMHPRTRALLAKQEAYKGRLDSLVKTGAVKSGNMPAKSGKNYYQITEPWRNPNYLDSKGKDFLFSMASKRVTSEKERRLFQSQ